MFRFLRASLRRRHPLARLTHPGPALATLTLSFGALALHASSNDPTQAPDQPPLSSLLRAYLVFSLCSLPSLVDASPRILSFLSAIPLLRDASDAFLKVTFFDQFVGAETIDACIPVLHKLHKSNQGVLFSYSVERPHGSETTPDPSQRALESILHSIDVAADFEDSLCASSPKRATGTWVAVKLSTLLPDPSALCVLSDWIVRQQMNQPQPQVPFPGAPDAQHLPRFLQPNETETAQTLRTLHTHLRRICARAHARGIRLTIDAEETWFQPAIDLFSVLLMQEFNSLKAPSGPQQPLVYATLQAYLVRTPALLDLLVSHARENEYSLGVKLVRGAYLDAETHAHRGRPQSCHSPHCPAAEGAVAVRAQETGSRSISPDENPPTYPDKASTDAAYDHCVRVLVGEVARDVQRGSGDRTTVPRVAVLFGTHNWTSSRLVLDEVLRVGLAEEEEEFGNGSADIAGVERKVVLSERVRQRVCMAQLYGMSDSLAAYLVDRTSRRKDSPPSPFVIRYVPYGPLRDVMPYLARRAVENRSVLGSASVGLVPGQGGGVEGGRGGAVDERRRIGRLIWERVVAFWTLD